MKKTILSLLFVVSVSAQVTDDPPVNAEELLGTVKKIITTNQEGQQAEFQKAIKDFGAAAASPSAATAFYVQAVRAISFEGRSKGVPEFNQWKASNAVMLDDKYFQRWIQLYLVYLTLELRHISGEPIKALEPELLTYTENVLESLKIFEKENLENRKELTSYCNTYSLNVPLKNRRDNGNGWLPFATWYQLEDFVGGQKGWEMTPGSVDGIYDTMLFPLYREQKNPHLLELWESRLARYEADVKRGGVAANQEKFNNVDRPRYLWARSADYLALGLKNKALNERIGILRQFPTHPNFEQWAKELQDILKPPAK